MDIQLGMVIKLSDSPHLSTLTSGNSMTHPSETDKELSIDELKDVSGGIRAQGGGYREDSAMAKKKNMSKSETMIGAQGKDELNIYPIRSGVVGPDSDYCPGFGSDK